MSGIKFDYPVPVGRCKRFIGSASRRIAQKHNGAEDKEKSAFGYSIRQSGVLYNRAREIDESYFGICLHGE